MLTPFLLCFFLGVPGFFASPFFLLFLLILHPHGLCITGWCDSAGRARKSKWKIPGVVRLSQYRLGISSRRVKDTAISAHPVNLKNQFLDSHNQYTKEILQEQCVASFSSAMQSSRPITVHKAQTPYTSCPPVTAHGDAYWGLSSLPKACFPYGPHTIHTVSCYVFVIGSERLYPSSPSLQPSRCQRRRGRSQRRKRRKRRKFSHSMCPRQAVRARRRAILKRE